MKNIEKYAEQIENYKGDDSHRCYVYLKLMNNKNCNGECCSDSCFVKTIKWLNEEYVEPIQLSYDEYVILKNLPSEYKWIWRTIKGYLWIYKKKPTKDKTGHYIECDDYCIIPFEHLFEFVAFEDKEPYSIQQLIANYEKEHEDDC